MRNADAALLKEICAGIEEEGVLYECLPHPDASADAATDATSLALLACEASMLGVGIGIRAQTVSLHIKGMNVAQSTNRATPLFFYESATPATSRHLGANAARVIKKLPFRIEE
jgi:hypothetical protein